MTDQELNIVERVPTRRETGNPFPRRIESCKHKDPKTDKISYWQRVIKELKGGQVEIGDWYQINAHSYSLEDGKALNL